MTRAALILALALASAARADSLTEYAFDPGLAVRRLANIRATTDPLYWESCPDDAAGCRPLCAGEGFHSLVGGTLNQVAIGCAVGSGGTCPFYAVWDAGGLSLGLVTTAMPNPDTYNTYLGLQDNLPQYGTAYRMGSFDHPAITHAATAFSIADQFVSVPLGSHARVLSGIAWWTPAGSFVLEMDIDVANVWSFWPITNRVQHISNCAPVTCLYLGGRAWGIGSRTGTTRTPVFIDWSLIARKLVASGDLPASALSDSYIADGWYTGQEVVGAAIVAVQIADRHIYAINHSPRGSFDALTGALAKGWACDWDAPATALTVDLYADGPRGSGTRVASAPANLPAPAGECPGAHGFKIPLVPAGRSYFAYATDPATGETVLLSGSARR